MDLNYNLLLNERDPEGNFYFNKIIINHDGIAQLKVFYGGLYRQTVDIETRKKGNNDNAERSMRRTKAKIRDYAVNNDFDYFVTFTFARNEDGYYYYKGEKFDIKKTKVVYNFIRAFYRKVNMQAKRKGLVAMKYLFVLEQHKSGHLHVHGLIKDLPEEYLTDSGKIYKNGEKILNVKGWDHGFSTALKIVRNTPDDSHKIASYMTQYMTVGLAETFHKGEMRYYASKGLNKPYEAYDVDLGFLEDLGVVDIFENDFYKDNKEYKVFNLEFIKENVLKLLTD